MKFEIHNRWTGAVQYECELSAEADTWNVGLRLGFAIKSAVLDGANLVGASLVGASLDGASLDGANLARANLIDAGYRSDGYRFFASIYNDNLMIHTGYRCFTVVQAREHWESTRGGTQLGDESLAMVDHLERMAKIRGLIAN